MAGIGGLYITRMVTTASPRAGAAALIAAERGFDVCFAPVKPRVARPRTVSALRRAARAAAPALALLALIGCGSGRTVPKQYTGPVRHVVFISLDTTRADHLGCYGNPWIRTPHLDALARESIQLLQYTTAATTTLPSHVALLSGKYPHSHGVPRNGFVIDRRNVLLPEILHDAGFATAGFPGSFALDSRFGFSRGFDVYDETYSTMMGTAGADQNQRTAGEVTDAVVRYLDRAPTPQHLFLFVHYFDPHLPYAPPPPYDTMYAAAPAAGRIAMTGHPALATARSDEEQKRLALYAGEISYMDEQVGRLLDDLKRRGILDDALVVVTSDHGENLGDAPGPAFDHGWSVFEVEAHTVGLIRLPGGAHGGTKSATLVSSVDVLPTVLRAMRLPEPPGIDGTALDLTAMPTAPDARVRFAEASKPWGPVERGVPWTNLRKPRCARTSTLKYVRTPFRGTEEFYDLAADPREQRDLIADPARRQPGPEKELRDALAAWDASAKPLPSEFDPNQDAETLRRLRSLGYLGGRAGE